MSLDSRGPMQKRTRQKTRFIQTILAQDRFNQGNHIPFRTLKLSISYPKLPIDSSERSLLYCRARFCARHLVRLSTLASLYERSIRLALIEKVGAYRHVRSRRQNLSDDLRRRTVSGTDFDFSEAKRSDLSFHCGGHREIVPVERHACRR